MVDEIQCVEQVAPARPSEDLLREGQSVIIDGVNIQEGTVRDAPAAHALLANELALVAFVRTTDCYARIDAVLNFLSADEMEALFERFSVSFLGGGIQYNYLEVVQRQFMDRILCRIDRSDSWFIALVERIERWYSDLPEVVRANKAIHGRFLEICLADRIQDQGFFRDRIEASVDYYGADTELGRCEDVEFLQAVVTGEIDREDKGAVEKQEGALGRLSTLLEPAAYEAFLRRLVGRGVRFLEDVCFYNKEPNPVFSHIDGYKVFARRARPIVVFALMKLGEMQAPTDWDAYYANSGEVAAE
jgi:hypothetical protein